MRSPPLHGVLRSDADEQPGQTENIAVDRIAAGGMGTDF